VEPFSDLQIVRSRRRTLALQVRPDGSLLVRAPHFLGDPAIRKFISQKSGWIEKTTRLVHERASLHRPKQFAEGETFLYLGKEYPLHIAEDMYGKLIFEDRFILAEKYRSKARRLFEKWYKEEAFSIFTSRCMFYAEKMEVRYKTISLTSARSRWGSCTPKGDLRFNWRLVMAPAEILDYVVVHELAHLKELNHSSRFWQKVETACPSYKTARKWLKQSSLSLNF